MRCCFWLPVINQSCIPNICYFPFVIFSLFSIQSTMYFISLKSKLSFQQILNEITFAFATLIIIFLGLSYLGPFFARIPMKAIFSSGQLLHQELQPKQVQPCPHLYTYQLRSLAWACLLSNICIAALSRHLWLPSANATLAGLSGFVFRNAASAVSFAKRGYPHTTADRIFACQRKRSLLVKHGHGFLKKYSRAHIFQTKIF